MLEQHPSSHSRKRFREWLEKRYQRDAAAWFSAWHLDQAQRDDLGLNSFEDIETAIIHRLADRCPGASVDLDSFSEILLKRYYQTLLTACKQAAPSSLCFGQCLPSHGGLPMLWYQTMAEECDVLSLDILEPGIELLELIESLSKLISKPIFISCFSFGAGDRGALANGACALQGQDDRGDAYRSLLQHAAAHPAIIGLQYKQLLDDPCLGDPIGRCSQVGLVDVCQREYLEFISAISSANAMAYSVRLGSIGPDGTPIDFVPASGF